MGLFIECDFLAFLSLFKYINNLLQIIKLTGISFGDYF